MTITRAQLRRLERLERMQAQPGDVGTCPAPPLPPEQLRVVLRMLVEAGGLQGERFETMRAALATTNVDELETREAANTLASD